MRTRTGRGARAATSRRASGTLRSVLLGVMAAIAVLGVGAFLWLSGGSAGTSIGGPFTLENGDGQVVTSRDFRGKYMLVYFGYTHCPDICPATLANMAQVFHRLGPQANKVRMLFVTVDPHRDTPGLLSSYVHAFAPQIDGLRGTPDALARLARRYRVIYSVTPKSAGQDYEVTHSSAVFFFGPHGHARFVTITTGDTKALADDLKRLLPS